MLVLQSLAAKWAAIYALINNSLKKLGLPGNPTLEFQGDVLESNSFRLTCQCAACLRARLAHQRKNPVVQMGGAAQSANDAHGDRTFSVCDSGKHVQPQPFVA